jgi:ABC-type multidrug transport system ATPase subunit
VCVDKFSKAYKVAFREPIVAVEQASFAVDFGECFALLGVNGAGKSTTFKSLTNVVIPSDGKIKVRGKEITKNFSDIRHRVGYCPQHHALFNDVTVIEHLEFYA